MKFLEQLAEKLIAGNPEDLRAIAVVLPSKRAGLFLKKHLAEKIKRPFFPPQVITFNEFLALYSDKRMAELPELLFLLYETYCEINPDSQESFDRFSKWASILLNDFNEIDRYLVEPEKIFIDLKNIKVQELEIEHWSFNAEELSLSQKNYLEFWKGLPAYHANFNQRLTKHNLAYQGALYREVAISIAELEHRNTYSHIYFAGFNALSVSEMKIISHLYEAKQASLFFDADKWYTNDGEHEAGLFFRKLRAQWGDYGFEFMDEFYKKYPKKIKVIAVSGQITQARVAGQLLNQVGAYKQQADTALVLADENLLLPVLNSLPENIDKVNITMGFPLKNSDYFNLIELIFDLQSTLKRKNEKTLIYHKSFLQLISHPIISTFLGDESRKLKTHLLINGFVYFEFKELDELSPEQLNKLSFLFQTWKTVPDDCLDYLIRTNKTLCDFYLDRKFDALTLEYIYHFSGILDYIQSICKRYTYIKETGTLLNLIRQYIAQTSISFYGEPLSGIQLMGMLETRALDFKHVIVLGVNENSLPKSKKENSFILHEVKKMYGLPTYREKDAVFANHFYRLLQRAENCYLVYDNDTDALNGGEKSRFIQQLEHELILVSPESSVEEYQVQLPFENQQHSELEIKKTLLVVQKISEHLSNGISPSALNTYLECPLNYYYRYIIGLKEEQSIDEVADDALLGTIIHAVLEQAYQQFIDQQIKQEDLQSFHQTIERELKVQFLKHAKHIPVDEGKNHLLFIVAFEFVNNFIRNEIELLKAEQPLIKLIHTETVLKSTIPIKYKNASLPLQLKGTADRIDQYNDTLRIIDYKTGRFSATDIQLTEISLEELRKKPKAVQVLLYALMYVEQNTAGLKVSAGIVPLKSTTSAFVPLTINKDPIISKEHLHQFTNVLTELVEELMDDQKVLLHNPKANFCDWCV